MWTTRIYIWWNSGKVLINSQKLFLFPPWQSTKQLSNLISSLEIVEPHNPELFYRMSLPFTRVVRWFPVFYLCSWCYNIGPFFWRHLWRSCWLKSVSLGISAFTAFIVVFFLIVWTKWESDRADVQNGGKRFLFGIGRLRFSHRVGLPDGASGQNQGGHEVVQDGHDFGWN